MPPCPRPPLLRLPWPPCYCHAPPATAMPPLLTPVPSLPSCALQAVGSVSQAFTQLASQVAVPPIGLAMSLAAAGLVLVGGGEYMFPGRLGWGCWWPRPVGPMKIVVRVVEVVRWLRWLRF